MQYSSILLTLGSVRSQISPEEERALRELCSNVRWANGTSYWPACEDMFSNPCTWEGVECEANVVGLYA